MCCAILHRRLLDRPPVGRVPCLRRQEIGLVLASRPLAGREQRPGARSGADRFRHRASPVGGGGLRLQIHAPSLMSPKHANEGRRARTSIRGSAMADNPAVGAAVPWLSWISTGFESRRDRQFILGPFWTHMLQFAPERLAKPVFFRISLIVRMLSAKGFADVADTSCACVHSMSAVEEGVDRIRQWRGRADLNRAV